MISALLFLNPGPARVLWAQDPNAQTGVVTGTVRDEFGGAVAGATVTAGGRTATTDGSGQFRIEGVPANEAVSVSASSGSKSTVELISLAAGQVQTVALQFEAGEEGDVIDVTDRRLQAGSVAGLKIRQEAVEVQDNITAEELGKTTAGDVAQAVQQLPAVTIVGGRFAFIRGLGDRYSQTLLDGSSLPSPEPDKRTVPLDLFPIGMIEQVAVAKTYSPDLPGEFAGGSVQAFTVGVPVAPFLKFSVSTTYNDGTSFRRFDTYEGGRLDAFGYDDGSRALPSAVPAQQVTGGSAGLSEAQIIAIGASFDDNVSPHRTTAPLDGSIKLSFGDSWEIGEMGRLGIVGAASYSNSYDYVEDEQRNVVEVSLGELSLNSTYELDVSTRNVELAAILAMTYEITPAQSITWRSLLSRASEDRVQFQEGFDGQNEGADVQFIRLQYIERLLANTQFSGKHLLEGDMFFTWRASGSLTERDQPDTRQNKYVDLDDDGIFEWDTGTTAGIRHFFFQTDRVYDFGFDFAIPFNPFGIEEKEEPDPDRLEPGQYIKFGAALTTRDRTLDTRKFRFFGDTSAVDLTLPPDEILSQENIAAGIFQINEQTRPTDNYEAEQDLLAGYVSTSIRVLDDVRLAGGFRVERSQQDVATFDLFSDASVSANLDDTDVLPALNLTWEFAENQQFRFGASQTVSRPEFRELAEFEFSDVEGGFGVVGNPSLQRAVLRNYDLRWEWFPSDDELVSASFFAKTFEDPIEQVKLPTGGAPLTSFDNAESAELFGFEVEGRKNLDFLGSFWEPFTLRGNFAWIESEVETSDNPLTIQTSSSRPLQGQPEYTANLGIFFDDKTSGISASLLANTFGERIDSVGTGGIPDFYEQPRVQLDFVISKKFKNDSKLKLSFGNILDEDTEIKSGNLTQRKFNRGFSIGLSYSIDL